MLKTWLRIMTVGSKIPEEGLTLLLDVVTNHGFRDDAAVHYYLGRLGSQPVATSLLYLSGAWPASTTWQPFQRFGGKGLVVP